MDRTRENSKTSEGKEQELGKWGGEQCAATPEKKILIEVNEEREI